MSSSSALPPQVTHVVFSFLGWNLLLSFKAAFETLWSIVCKLTLCGISKPTTQAKKHTHRDSGFIIYLFANPNSHYWLQEKQTMDRFEDMVQFANCVSQKVDCLIAFYFIWDPEEENFLFPSSDLLFDFQAGGKSSILLYFVFCFLYFFCFMLIIFFSLDRKINISSTIRLCVSCNGMYIYQNRLFYIYQDNWLIKTKVKTTVNESTKALVIKLNHYNGFHFRIKTTTIPKTW